jgi:hypothetical protein
MAGETARTGRGWGAAARVTAIALFLVAVVVIGWALRGVLTKRHREERVAVGPLAPLHAVVVSQRKLASPWHITASGGSLWVTQWSEQHAPAAVVRIDETTHRDVGQRIVFGNDQALSAMRIAAAAGGVYVRTAHGFGRVDRGYLVTVRAAAVPRQAMLSLYGEPGSARAWTTDHHGHLYELDPGGATAKRPVPIGRSRFDGHAGFLPTNVGPVFASDTVWLGQDTGEQHEVAWLQPVSPHGGAAGPPIRLGAGTVIMLVAGDDRLWATLFDERTSLLLQIDPAARRVIASTRLPRETAPTAGVYDHGSLWLADGSYNKLLRVKLVPGPSS